MAFILHTDGSSVRTKTGARKFALGYALVVNHDGEEFEQAGALEVPQHLTGMHEAYAGIEGLLLAHRRGVSPEDVVLHTDDELLGHAPLFLHLPNGYGQRAHNLEVRVRTLCNALFQKTDAEVVLEYLRRARCHKLKGHDLLVYQERTDYLAREAAWRVLEPSRAEPLDYDSWLARGMLVYTAPSVAQKWYAPFAGPQLQA